MGLSTSETYLAPAGKADPSRHNEAANETAALDVWGPATRSTS